MLRHPLALTLALAAGAAAALAPHSAGAVDPHHSWSTLTTGNGFGFATYSTDAHRLQTFTTHPYANHSPTETTPDLAYDAYFGLRASGGGAWLGELPVDSAQYVDQTHVIVSRQSYGPLQAETYAFSPWGVNAPAVAMVLHVTNASQLTLTDAAAYALMNFHLGSGAPEPGTDGEHVVWDSSTNSYSETGGSGLTVRYVPLVNPDRHGASPNNPYFTVKAGGDLVNTDDSGTGNDNVAGLQWSFPSMAPGEERWVGVLITTASAQDARAWANNRDPHALIDQEVSAWNQWRTAPPAGLSADETRAWRQSESVLRMAQSREAAPAGGQIVAALPPGIWWISWVRDQSYAVAALARSGHMAEASAAVDFWRTAHVGDYQSYVGHPYLLSVVRYYGNGAEWSDSNENGPNVEFDGFGLAPWAAHLAGRNELDPSVDTLRALVDNTGLIGKDSSIWEVHWDNNARKHFAYTSITAANAMCVTGDATSAHALRDAILANLTLPAGGVAGNLEELTGGLAHDAASVEAINFGLIDPMGRRASDTIADYERLRAPSGRGYFRNDDGGGYDSHEWIFIDMRIAAALLRMGRTAEANELIAWVTQQAEMNYDLIPELYHPLSGDYAGAIPMVGFGAGAYMLTLLDRANTEPRNTACFPAETTNMGGRDGGANGDGGTTGMGSGGCSTTGEPGSYAAIGLALAALVISAGRRRVPLPHWARVARRSPSPGGASTSLPPAHSSDSHTRDNSTFRTTRPS